jgi:hypothetical protein
LHLPAAKRHVNVYHLYLIKPTERIKMRNMVAAHILTKTPGASQRLKVIDYKQLEAISPQREDYEVTIAEAIASSAGGATGVCPALAGSGGAGGRAGSMGAGGGGGSGRAIGGCFLWHAPATRLSATIAASRPERDPRRDVMS